MKTLLVVLLLAASLPLVQAKDDHAPQSLQRVDLNKGDQRRDPNKGDQRRNPNKGDQRRDPLSLLILLRSLTFGL